MLVNQLKTGSLDAAVAYLSNAAGSGDVLDAIRIQGLQCSVATQPYAVAEKSPNAETASRLFKQICSTESKSSFAAEGFGWKLDAVQQPMPTTVEQE
jgi:ABC-type molybdate transport system substrate-binding protein